MSSEKKIKYEIALRQAQYVVAQLQPYCDRIEVAGSIRRECPGVGDIEVVCIPKVDMTGLFNDIPQRNADFCQAVDSWDKINGQAAGKYMQRILPSGINLDIFTATADNWGLIFAIRTGSAIYSHNVLARRWVSLGYKSVDGELRKYNDYDNPIALPEEKDLFDLLGIHYDRPQARNF